jgi:hypothetical protein
MSNVIEFPKKTKKKFETNDKLRIAYKLIEEMNKNGMDFHIVVEREVAEKVFELEGITGNKAVMTSSLEKARDLKIKGAMYYEIEGDEF